MYDNLNNILIPRRLEDRKERYKILIQRRIQQYIKNGCIGNLDLTNSSFEKLPDNLIKVGGYLGLFNSQIKSLNNLESVGGSLDLDYSTIESLGKLESVGEYLDLEHTPIKSLGNLKFVGGDIWLRNSFLENYTKNEIMRMVNVKEEDIHI